MKSKGAFLILFGLILITPSARGQSPPPSTASESRGNVVAGRVVSQGKPLAGALVTLWDESLSEPTEHNTVATGRTNEEGNYELRKVRLGNYFISATADGFVTGKENKILANLRRVTIAGTKALDAVNFELVPAGVIKGTVTDADGKLIARIPVTVLAEVLPPEAASSKAVRDTLTDDQGNYRMAGLPSGRYRVAAGYQPMIRATLVRRAAYRQRFYGDAPDEAHAKLIEISPGLEVTQVNINLGNPVKGFTVRAKILDSQTGKPVEDIGYDVAAFENGKRIGGVGARGRSNSRGEITIESVPPGEYSITVPGGSAVVPKGEVPPVPNIFGDSKHFEVTDADVSDVEIRVMRAATVSGFVVIEGAAGLDVLANVPQMYLAASVIMSRMRNTSIKPDGSFTFTGLRPGKVQFMFSPLPGSPPLPLRFAGVERDGVRLNKDLEVQPGEQITGIHLVLAYANSSIHGVVRLDNGRLPADANGRAILVQYGKSIEGASLDSHGEFILDHLAAGEYTLIVFAHSGNQPEWKTERHVTVTDNKVSELTVSLDSTSNRARAASPTGAVPR